MLSLLQTPNPILACVSFDFSDQIALQRADSFSSSSDDSESDDEALDFLIAGPNHSDAQETLVTEPVDDSYAKVWPDEQLVETYDIRDEDGDIESPNTGEMPIEKSSMCELPPELPALSPSVSSAGGRKNMLDESIHSTKSAKKGIGFRRRKSTDHLPDMSPLDVTNNEDPNLALTKSERHFAKQASLLDSDDSNKHITKYDDDMPKVHFESVESIESKKKKTKHAAVLGRVAKTIKASTVIKHGKKVGKGTVNAGKAVGKGTVIAGKAAGRVIPVSSVVYSYKPPTKHEPGTSITRPNRSQKNHKISLRTVNKALKNIKGQNLFLFFLYCVINMVRKISHDFVVQ